VTARSAALWRRGFEYLLIGSALAALLVHVSGWTMAAAGLWQQAAPHVPRIQSTIVLAIGLVIIRATATARRTARRLIVILALAATCAGLVAAPLPLSFEGNGYMSDGVDNTGDRAKFERRFPIAHGPTMSFHSHLGDLLMARLDRAFAGSGNSTARAYATLSRIGGLLFVLELLLVAAWHRWSRRICRYVGLMVASPLSLLYFGYYELGYLAVSVAAIPLLSLRRRSDVETTAATLTAGLLQGLHTALHGFGLLGLAGGALYATADRGDLPRRVVRMFTFAAAGVAMYLGWIFIYVVGMKISIIVDNAVNSFSLRRLFDQAIYDQRIAYPVFSALGLGEVGIISLLSGVPLLVLAAARTGRASLAAAAAFALPGLLFLIAWWPPGAPYNLDLLMAAFPGLCAACWLLSSRFPKTISAYVVIALLHLLFWTTIGSTVFERVWVGGTA
jgi:hypothetical protein